MISRALVFVTAIAVCTIAALPAHAQNGRVGDQQNSALAGPNVLVPFLKQYCVRCHGSRKQAGDLALHELGTNPVRGLQIEIRRRMLDQLESGEMPPEDAKQPSPDRRKQVTLWIRRELRQAGAAVDDGRRWHPSRGNWVDHDALFSGKGATKTATRGRLWRLTGQGYEEFMQHLNVEYRLGFRTYGHRRIRSPWELSPHAGFRDYASQHRIGEPEIEHHLRNATRVARAMVARLSKSKRNDMRALQYLLKTGNASTAVARVAGNPEFSKVSQHVRRLKRLVKRYERTFTDNHPRLKSARQKLRAAENALGELPKTLTRDEAGAAFKGILGRQPSQEELDRYAGFLRSNLQTLGPEKAVEQLLIAILFHPEVMYRLELPAGGATRGPMAARDLARAIAYALTDREPDEELRQAAAAGKLVQRKQIRGQVVRILDDREIAKPRMLRFFQEYFGYTAAIDVFKDSATRKAAGFRGSNDWHPNFFVSDADRLVESILEQDKQVLYKLLTTTKTFALTGNTKQAKGVKKNASKPFSLFAQTALEIYELDITREDWSDDRPFEMPQEHRMGILTHPSWLIAHSTNFDNHAIGRGRWIRERLLGGRIPEILVTVDAQLPDEPENTLRQRMRVTREKNCWKCHQLMDPLGLPFENFDHFGRFRTTEMGRPVDTAGNVRQSGDPRLDGPVKAPFELLRKLASSQRVQQVFVRHVFRYFLGRNETLADGPTLVAAHRAYADGGGSMHALITSLLTSDAFLYRTSGDAEEDRGRKAARRKP